MRPALDTRDIDRDGIWHIGRGTRGCRHCGKTEMHYAENGKAVIHHPGTTCCPSAIRDQIAWREADLARLRKLAREAREEVDEVHRRAERAIGREAADARALAERAERGYAARLARWQLLTDGGVDPLNRGEPPHLGSKQEIRDLERLLEAVAA